MHTSCTQDVITHALESGLDPDASADASNDRADAFGDTDLGDSDMNPSSSAYTLGGSLDADASVYQSMFPNGTSWEGHPEGAFMHVTSNRPQPWAIATVHASMLLRQAGLDVSPNEVLSHALRSSRLRCNEGGNNGCFGISVQTYNDLLRRDFPETFGGPSFDDVIGDQNYPSAALAFAYLGVHTIAALQLYTDDPLGALERTTDERAVAKAIMLSARFSPFESRNWERVLDGCDEPIELCFTDGRDIFREDIIGATMAYADGLAASSPYDVGFTLGDMDAYMTTIQDLYPDADVTEARERLRDEYTSIRNERGNVSFDRDITRLLEPVITILGRPTLEQATEALCARGQLGGSPPCP